MVIWASETQEIRVPGWVADFESFRRWAHSDDFPEVGRVSWINGEVWIDMTREQVFSHGQLKLAIATGWHAVSRAGQLGLAFTDGLFLTNPAADFAGNPDGTFLSDDTLRSGRVQMLERVDDDYSEVQGSPDAVLEVVSTSSVRKDTVVLKQAYWEAGIREYWLVDARREPLKFDIFRHTPKGYAPTRKRDGWLRSAVFGKSFRLVQATNALGHPEFKLEVK